MKPWNRKILVILAMFGLLIAACGESLDETEPDQGSADGGASGDRSGWPETIQYGLLPTDDMDDLVALYTPFEEYMATCLDHPFKLFTGTNYTAMVEAMRTGNLHISRFGAFSYILAHDRAGAEAIAVPVADPDDATYRSLIITLKSHGFSSLADLEGTTFSFVDPASTSGHLFPRALIVNEMGITNEEVESWFGEVVFAGNHEASLLSVLNEDTDAGALVSTSDLITNEGGTWQILDDGDAGDHPNADDFTVLTESGDIPRTVEAIQQDLPDSLKDAVMSCLEGVVDDPSLADFREEGGFDAGYIPASDSDYDVVRETANALGMGPEDLLDE